MVLECMTFLPGSVDRCCHDTHLSTFLGWPDHLGGASPAGFRTVNFLLLVKVLNRETILSNKRYHLGSLEDYNIVMQIYEGKTIREKTPTH